MPGRWRTRVVEFMREPMDCISDPRTREVVIMAGAQVAKTEVILNTIGYLIDYDPSPMIAVQPNLDMMKAFSKDRIAPMIRDTRVLSKRVQDAKSRNADNTISQKTFPGGHLTMIGANSPAGLASRPIRAVFFDEVDRFPLSAGTEGDPVKLAIKRTTTFWNRIIVMVSTPTVKDGSRIEKAYLSGDQRERWCPCPHCGDKHVLKWKNIRWSDGDPHSAEYICPDCGCAWTDAQRINSVRQGEWRAKRPFKGIASFHVPGLISPFVSMAEAVTDFLASKDDPELLQVWVNTYLGETWEEHGERIDGNELFTRREEYDSFIPEEVSVITAGMDVQDNRVEIELVGWGEGYDSWSLDHHVIFGDPSTSEFWDEVDEYRTRVYQHPLFGDMWAQRACIDTGGHFTQQVYRYVRGKQPSLFGIKGIGGQGKPIVGRPTTNNTGKIPLVPVGTHTAKELVLRRLGAKEGQAGRCHFPMHYDAEYFSQMTSEELVTKFHKGYKKQEFVAKRKRNEVFDCRVYATAALEMTGIDIASHRRAMEIRLEKETKERRKKPGAKKYQSRVLSQRKKSSFVDSWRE